MRLTIGDGPLTFILMLNSYGWWVVVLDYSVSSGPFLSYEIEIGDGPGPELDNILFCSITPTNLGQIL